jgi:hypothetical protein
LAPSPPPHGLPPHASFLILFFGNREKAGTAKAATNGKTMTITTPNNLVAKLAAKLKGTIDTPLEQYSNFFWYLVFGSFSDKKLN